MVLVTGTPESPQLTLQPWIRVVRQESVYENKWVFVRHYVVDFVHADYFATFVADHAVPFGREVSSRVEEAKVFLAKGRGAVRDLLNWRWGEMS